MKLLKARVQKYRSIIDTGLFDVEILKTIMVGPNEAGKTVILKALQQLNKPKEIPGFDVLRDYPRSLYNDITTGKVSPGNVVVVTGYFSLEENDKALIPVEFQSCTYKIDKYLDNSFVHDLENCPSEICYRDIKSDLMRLIAHLDKQYTVENPDEETKKPSIIFRNGIFVF